MADTWSVNIQHFLNQDGSIGVKSGSGRRLAEHFVAIIYETTCDMDGDGSHSLVQCRRRPNRKPCSGKIASFIDPDDDAIVWRCPECGDNGWISGWTGTLWDMSGFSTTH